MNTKMIITAGFAATAIAALSACNATGPNAAGSSNTMATTGTTKTATAVKANVPAKAKAAPAKPKAPAQPKAPAKPKAPPAPSLTVSEQNAIESAQSYLDMGNGFSRTGLIGQLSSKAGEGFPLADAVFAVNHLNVNWYKQAVLSAKSYLSMGTGFSRADLIDQLHSQAGEGFTLAQATYAANQVGL